MSAWRVSHNHIRLLVEALYKYELVKEECFTTDALGALLWKENYRSVNYCYNERKRMPQYIHDSAAVAAWSIPHDGQGTIRDLVRNPALVYKQAQCYCYQSRERPDWTKTQAYVLTARLIDYLSVYGDTMDNELPWGIY